MNYQLRLELQVSLGQWITDVMASYNIPATMMEDALNKALLDIKDKVHQELLMQQLEAAKQQKSVEFEPEEEKEEGSNE
jgi:hypothetical protein